MKIIFILLATLGFSVSHAADVPAERDSLKVVLAECQTFKATLAKLGYQSGVISLPEDPSRTDGRTVDIFWWKRPAKPENTTLNFPPLVYIHGGVASTSHAMVSRWTEVLNQYPGDIVAFDHRGEGCSKTIGSNLPDPSAYQTLRLKYVVDDIEALGQKLIGPNVKWRIYGHSRGGALAHQLIAKYPQSIERAYISGFSYSPDRHDNLNYMVTRMHGNQLTADAYLVKHPEDLDGVGRVRTFIDAQKPTICWLGLDNFQICGSTILDMESSNFSSTVSWETILHPTIQKLADAAQKGDLDTVRTTLQAHLNSDLYGHLNYINYTNGLDIGSMNIGLLASLTNPLSLDGPFLSEARWILSMTNSHRQAGDPVAEVNDVEGIDLPALKNNIDKYGIPVRIFAGAMDNFVPPEMYANEVAFFKGDSNFTFQVVPDVSHNVWYSDTVIKMLSQPEPPLK